MMLLHSPLVSSSPFDLMSCSRVPLGSFNESSAAETTPAVSWSAKKQPSFQATVSSGFKLQAPDGCYPPQGACRFCSCVGRRQLLLQAAAASSAFLPILPSTASPQQPDYTAVLNEVHPPRPDWYEELYASVMSSGMESYEAEIAAYKSQLFANLRGKAKKVLEVGIGTGPNLKYYASETDVQVLGVDPNRKMERYAREAAAAAGLPPANFQFLQAVGEAIPLSDASMDAVVGTLVLCSVKDVDQALQEVKRVLKPGGFYLFVEHVAAKDGSILRWVQNVLDPLQQAVADGCHLTRKTGEYILNSRFSQVDLNMAFLSNASLINPHVYGIARK